MRRDPFNGVKAYPNDAVPEGELHMHPRDYQNAIGCYRPNAADGRQCEMVRTLRLFPPHYLIPRIPTL